jgi:hypothetical protein
MVFLQSLVREAARLKPVSGSAVDRDNGISWTVEDKGRFGQMITSLSVANAALTPMKPVERCYQRFKK